MHVIVIISLLILLFCVTVGLIYLVISFSEPADDFEEEAENSPDTNKTTAKPAKKTTKHTPDFKPSTVEKKSSIVEVRNGKLVSHGLKHEFQNTLHTMGGPEPDFQPKPVTNFVSEEVKEDFTAMAKKMSSAESAAEANLKKPDTDLPNKKPAAPEPHVPAYLKPDIEEEKDMNKEETFRPELDQPDFSIEEDFDEKYGQ